MTLIDQIRRSREPFRPDRDLHITPEVKEGYFHTFRPVKWKPYKPGAQTQKAGRWQSMNEWGGWDNCETPEEVWSEPADIAAMKAALLAAEEIAQCLDAVLRVDDEWVRSTAHNAAADALAAWAKATGAAE